MSRGKALAIIIGHAGADPVFSVTQGGRHVAKLSLATTFTAKREGQKVDTTDWHRIVAFERNADTLRDFVHKGDLVHIEGRLTFNRWTDKTTGQPRSEPQILVSDITLLSRPKEHKNQASGETNSADAAVAFDEQGVGEDDLSSVF
jgi:single-strand DNA-binding protein